MDGVRRGERKRSALSRSGEDGAAFSYETALGASAPSGQLVPEEGVGQRHKCACWRLVAPAPWPPSVFS